MCPSGKKLFKKISDHRGNRFGTSIQCQINHNVEVSDVYLMSVDCIRKYDRYTMEIHPYSQENYTRIIKNPIQISSPICYSVYIVEFV